MQVNMLRSMLVARLAPHLRTATVAVLGAAHIVAAVAAIQYDERIAPALSRGADAFSRATLPAAMRLGAVLRRAETDLV
jgi:hypothetical protein